MEKLRALVVDDNWYNCDIFRIALERANYEVSIAYNGRDGLALLNNNRYHILVIDLHMPGIDGIGVLTEIKDSEMRKQMYVLVVTAGASHEAQQVKELCDRVLFKPVKVSDLTVFLDEVKRTL